MLNKEFAQTTKCIADRVLNYLSQIQNRIPEDKYPNLQTKIQVWNDIFEMHKNLRVDLYFGNNNPIGSASAIVYLNVVKNNVKITQSEISYITGHSTASIRVNYIRILKHLQKSQSIKEYKNNWFNERVLELKLQ